MAYTTPSKAIELAHQIADVLKVRQSLTVTESFDTDGNPLISVGTLTAGSAGATIKIQPVAWPLANDILGNAANIYSPSKIMLGTEARTGNGGWMTHAQLLPLLGEALLHGALLEWYETSSGTAPTVANTVFASGNLIASFYPDIYNPLTNQQ